MLRKIVFHPLIDLKFSLFFLMNIFLFADTGVGNLILKIPLINEILKADSSNVDVLVKNDVAASVLSGLNSNCTVYRRSEFRGLFFNLATSLFNEDKYDYVYMPFDAYTWSEALFVSLLCRKRVVAHIIDGDQSFSTVIKRILFYVFSVKVVPVLPARHEIDLNLDLLQSNLSYEIVRDYRYQISYDLEKFYMPDFFDCAGQYIVFEIGARSGHNTPKKWPYEKFSSLYRRIKEKYSSLNVVLVGDDGDAELCNKFSLEHPDVINTAGKTDINDVSIILARCALCVVHDSGAMHIANGVGAISVCLFGPTDISRTGPLTSRSKIIVSDNDCRNSMFYFGSNEDELYDTYGETYCMSQIAVSTVFDCVVKILDEYQSNN